MNQISALRTRFVTAAVALALGTACSDETTTLPDGPDTGSVSMPVDQGLPLDFELDAGASCAACVPARNGLFCGFTVGCGANQPQPACHFDGSGDAAFPPLQCGCDGQLFQPRRFGGQNGQAAADRPFGPPSLCTLPQG